MIPTKLKARLPPHLSWPIGVKDLSDLVDGAAVTTLLSVSFQNPPNWAPLLRVPLQEISRYLVIEAKHFPPREAGYIGSDWEVPTGHEDHVWAVAVYPVRREHRHITNSLIRLQGGTTLLSWLIEASRPEMKWRQSSVRLFLDVESLKLLNEAHAGA